MTTQKHITLAYHLVNEKETMHKEVPNKYLKSDNREIQTAKTIATDVQLDSPTVQVT